MSKIHFSHVANIAQSPKGSLVIRKPPHCVFPLCRPLEARYKIAIRKGRNHLFLPNCVAGSRERPGRKRHTASEYVQSTHHHLCWPPLRRPRVCGLHKWGKIIRCRQTSPSAIAAFSLSLLLHHLICPRAVSLLSSSIHAPEAERSPELWTQHFHSIRAAAVSTRISNREERGGREREKRQPEIKGQKKAKRDCVRGRKREGAKRIYFWPKNRAETGGLKGRRRRRERRWGICKEQ